MSTAPDKVELSPLGDICQLQHFLKFQPLSFISILDFISFGLHCENNRNRAIRLKLCGNCAFPQNFHNRELGEISVFYAVLFSSPLLCHIKLCPYKQLEKSNAVKHTNW